MRILLSLLLLSLMAARTAAQTARFTGEDIVITDGSRKIRLTEYLEPHPVAATVHAVRKVKGEYFLVVGAIEYTKGYPPRGGRCGGGTEGYLEWLHVVGGQIADRTKGLYLSCRQNRDGTVTGWRGTVLSAETREGMRKEEAPGKFISGTRTIRFTVDLAHLADGLKEEAAEEWSPAAKAE